MELVYIITAIAAVIYSYGFRDPNLPLFAGSRLAGALVPLETLVFSRMVLSAGIFTLILTVLTVLYLRILREAGRGALGKRQFTRMLVAVCLFTLSYPALTHDMFNYMTTARVLYKYHENPYVVMPVELTGEPYLRFTRAANKVALYGPVWLALSGIPYTTGGGNLFATILSFKMFAALSYVLTVYLLYRMTKRLSVAAFFAFNPLVIVEVLISGHNDLWMMIPAVTALYLWSFKSVWYRMAGIAALAASVFVKGATLALAPVFMMRTTMSRRIVWAFWAMAAVMIIFGPIREELYPWYAVWTLVFAAFLFGTKRTFIPVLSVVASVALELRHLPYVATMRYDGYAPFFKSLVTVVPPVTYILWYVLKRRSVKP